VKQENTMKKLTIPVVAVALALAWPIGMASQQPAPAERVAAIKQSFQDSQMRLRQYEWVETTVVSLKGDEKSRKQSRCYFGADGKTEKIPLQQEAAKAPPRGLKGHVVAKKKEELTDYMDRAVAMLHRYVPPNPDNLQASKNAGKVTLNMLDPGKRARIDFRDYLQPGDVLGIETDLVNNRLLGAHVSTFLDAPDDAVILDVTFAALDDGTTYQAKTTLDAKAKQVVVNVENAGYRKRSGQ
jgi:hypothetical protein